MSKYSKRDNKRAVGATDWDSVASWYDGWVGKKGSEHHRKFALPTLMQLLRPKRGEEILDIGCGQGVLTPFVVRAQAKYTGVDASARMLGLARKRHGKQGKFVLGDAGDLAALVQLQRASFDAALFMLSIQNMEPLDGVLKSASWALKAGGRLVLLLLHPCFRLPRQSGWGWDGDRRLQYRRIDRYKTPYFLHIKVPVQGRKGTTVNFHRPLESYINGLADAGLLVERIQEIPVCLAARPGPRARAEAAANREIPLFLGIRAIKHNGIIRE